MSMSLPSPPPNTYIPSQTNPSPNTPSAASPAAPLTATRAQPQRLHLKGPAPRPETLQPPTPEPISLEDNSDAIALRAAISVLQLQRQQALKDMRTLEKQKTRVLEDVEGFVDALGQGKVKMRDFGGILPADAGDGDDVGEHAEQKKMADRLVRGEQQEGEADRGGFGQMVIPGAQTVVRMPPIKWAKYHIVGESLDRLHQEQRVRPTGGFPEGARKEAEIAVPYDPFVDKLEPIGKFEAGEGGGLNGTRAQVDRLSSRRKSSGGKKG